MKMQTMKKEDVKTTCCKHKIDFNKRKLAH